MTKVKVSDHSFDQANGIKESLTGLQGLWTRGQSSVGNEGRQCRGAKSVHDKEASRDSAM